MTSMKRLERRKDKSARNRRRFGMLSTKEAIDKFNIGEELQRVVFDTGHKQLEHNRIHLPGIGWVRPSLRGTPFQIMEKDQVWRDASFEESRDIRMKLHAIMVEQDQQKFQAKKP